MLNRTPRTPVGGLIRQWRQRRRLSQLDLACDAGISTRHLSFVETGRAQPSRDMLLHLSEQLDVPVRERNVLLVAAGYAPIFPEPPALAAARAAVDLVLERQKPYPAFALDRHWRVVASNAALPQLYDGVAPELMKPRSTPCASRCIRAGWRRGSQISASGARISFSACAGRSSSRRTPC